MVLQVVMMVEKSAGPKQTNLHVMIPIIRLRFVDYEIHHIWIVPVSCWPNHSVAMFERRDGNVLSKNKGHLCWTTSQSSLWMTREKQEPRFIRDLIFVIHGHGFIVFPSLCVKGDDCCKKKSIHLQVMVLFYQSVVCFHVVVLNEL